MAGTWFEKVVPEKLLSLDGDPTAGELVSYDVNEQAIIAPLTTAIVTEQPEVLLPLAPALSGTMPLRNQVTLTWVAADNTGRSPVTEWQLQRRVSTDNGLTFDAWANSTGSPYPATQFDSTHSNLSTGTPEVLRQYRVRGNNVVGNGAWSNVVPLQWETVVVAVPTALTNFALAGNTATTRKFTYDLTVDATVDKHGLFEGTTLRVDNIAVPSGTSGAYEWTGLTPGQTYTNVAMARHNSAGWSPMSNTRTFTQSTVVDPPPASDIMMGTSDSGKGAGGTNEWTGWRVYREGTRDDRANQTGNARPLFLAFSKEGAPLNGSTAANTYSSVKAEVLADLNAFYYNGTTSTRSNKWGIRLYWSNGNENDNKGMLQNNTGPGTLTAAEIQRYVDSQRGLYEACHTLESNGDRRFPDAYAGSNPTQRHEWSGLTADWLHPSARYHDFVMWSMYPAGRGVNDTDLAVNSRWDWPAFENTSANLRDSQQGHLLRCFNRTKLAQTYARNNGGASDHKLIIGVGETGIASNPDDRSCRPYYAVHGLIGSMAILAVQFELQMDFACWWDNTTTEEPNPNPHNILNDEPPSSDHLYAGTGAAAGNNSVATNPSTRVAWQNWQEYDHRIVGKAALPAQWNGNPKSSWNQTGTPI